MSFFVALPQECYKWRYASAHFKRIKLEGHMTGKFETNKISPPLFKTLDAHSAYMTDWVDPYLSYMATHISNAYY